MVVVVVVVVIVVEELKEDDKGRYKLGYVIWLGLCFLEFFIRVC